MWRIQAVDEQLRAKATSMNAAGSWDPASMQNQLKTEENLKTQVSQRAAPALCAQLQIEGKKRMRGLDLE